MRDVHASALNLVALAMRVVTEGEPLDLSDQDIELEELSALRSHLSQMRTAIDLVNKGLAMYWAERYPGESFSTETTRFYLGKSKGKRIIDPDMFYEWLSQQPPEKLAKLISASSIKVGGFEPAERATFLDETPTAKDVSIQNQPIK